MNINGTDDPFYRYKMEPLDLTVTRKNGGTCIVKNTDAVVTSLARDPKQIAKYFSGVLKRPVKVVKGCWTFSGVVNVANLQEILQKYINAFVLCGTCGNPETKMSEKLTKMKCAGCGSTTRFS